MVFLFLFLRNKFQFTYAAFSHHLTAAMLIFPNNELSFFLGNVFFFLGKTFLLFGNTNIAAAKMLYNVRER